jgi:hypothetical protein
MRGGTRLGRFAAALALMTVIGSRTPAFADRVDDLTAMLSNSSEKTRLSAVLSLARLGDKRALKPLVQALQDPNAQIRAVAAAALGKLGHKAALPALRTAATDDLDETVRKSAHDAALAVAKTNHIDADLPVPGAPAPTPSAAASTALAPSHARKTTGFGRSPHAVEDRPDLYVTVKGCNDDSPGKTDKSTRRSHADVLMQTLKDDLRGARQVTMVENDAVRWGLEQRQIDVSVVKLEMTQAGGYVEVAAELRLAISDNTGKMMSFLSGGAKVQVPASKYKPAFLANMRKEALQGALNGLFDKLLAHLRQLPTT